jgi:hypothetical protein
MGDSFASLTGHFETMNELLAASQQRYEITTRLLELQGNAEELLRRQREAEMAATHELNRALLQTVYNLEDANRELQGAKGVVESAFSGLRASIDAEKGRIQDSFDSIISGIRKRLDVANQSLQKSRSIYDLLANSLRSRQVSGDDAFVGRRASAQAFLSRGNVMDEEGLREALSIVSEPSEGLFGSFVDYARDFGQTSALIEDAKRIAEVQVNHGEMQVLLLERQIAFAEASLQEQLEALELQYKTELDQYNALLGIDTSVRSVNESVLLLRSAILKLASAQAAQAAATKASNSTSVAPVPKFATGGMHSGGIRIVGERGPEIEATGPSRIFSRNQTASMFKDPDLKDAVRSLKEEVAGLRSEQRQIQMDISKYTKRTYDIERKWDVEGLPETRT